MLGFLWETLFKTPLATLLFWLTSLTGNMGVAIILLTLIIQLILIPLRLPSLKSAQKMQAIRPELDKLKEKHRNDQMALAQAQMELYKQHGINPFGGIITTLLSIPIILALYRVLLTTLQNEVSVSTHFLWLDVTQKDPYFVLPLTVGVSQYLMSKAMFSSGNTTYQKPTKKKHQENLEENLQQMMGQMNFFFPLLSALIVASLPSGVGIYWLISLLFNTLQQKIITG